MLKDKRKEHNHPVLRGGHVNCRTPQDSAVDIIVLCGWTPVGCVKEDALCVLSSPLLSPSLVFVVFGIGPRVPLVTVSDEHRDLSSLMPRRPTCPSLSMLALDKAKVR